MTRSIPEPLWSQPLTQIASICWIYWTFSHCIVQSKTKIETYYKQTNKQKPFTCHNKRVKVFISPKRKICRKWGHNLGWQPGPVKVILSVLIVFVGFFSVCCFIQHPAPVSNSLATDPQKWTRGFSYGPGGLSLQTRYQSWFRKWTHPVYTRPSSTLPSDWLIAIIKQDASQ